jgi:hypothetical protein
MRQKKYSYILALLLVGVSCFAHAGDLELYLNNDALQIDYLNDIRLMGMDQNKLSLGLFFDVDRDIIFNPSLTIPGLFKGKLPIPLSFSVGTKGYLALVNEPQDEQVFALAVGAGARFDIPIDIGMPMYVDAVYFYAPEILTFGGADNVKDFIARFEMDVIPRLTAFVGYRLLRFDLDDTGDHDFDDTFHIGIRYSF